MNCRRMMRVGLLVVVFIAALVAPGATPAAEGAAVQTWAKIFGFENRTEVVSSVQQTLDGGYIAVGLSWKSGVGTAAQLMKFDAAGQVQWQKLYPFSGGSPAPSLRQTPDGGYILAGHIYQWNSNFGWIGKLDQDGNIVWQKYFSGNPYSLVSYVQAYPLTLTDDGGAVVVTQNSRPGLIKYDGNGTPLWMVYYSGFRQDAVNINTIQQTPDGGYILGGTYFNGYQAVDPLDAFAMKVDQNGGMEWLKKFRTNDNMNETSYDLRRTAEGGYIMAVQAQPWCEADCTDPTSGAVLVKLDAQGDILWQNYSGGGYIPILISVMQTEDSGYVLASSSWLSGTLGWNAWVTKFDQAGSVEWEKQYDIYGHDHAASIQQTADGGYIMGGNISASTWDMWVMKLDANGSLEDCSSDIVHVLPGAMRPQAGLFGEDVPPPTFWKSEKPINGTIQIAGQQFDLPETTVCRSVGPKIGVAPGSVDFGPVELLAASSKSIIVTNATPNTVLTVATVGIAGTDGDKFSQTNDCSALAGGSSCTITVTFRPDGLGNKNAVLSVASDDQADPVVDVPLSGTGSDTIPPSTSVSVAGERGSGGWYVSTVLVTLAASDGGSGVSRVSFQVDAGAWQSVSGSTASLTLADDGRHTVHYAATDNAGNTETGRILEVNIDRTPPVLNVSVSPGSLWPPNHKMATVAPAVTVSDALGGAVRLELLSVDSNEDDNGTGDGDTGEDIVINPDGTLSLRAERSGTGSGRIYAITYRATDSAGNAATTAAYVTVPRDMR